MALILSLETSTEVCSVAIHEDKKLLNEIIIDEPQAHAAKLAPAIQELFNSLEIAAPALNAVAISSGPGSYTGLRIGTSTAKGLCYALNIPLIAVPTLSILAYQIHQMEMDGLLCPMIDARRMEVYCEVFDQRLKSIRPLEAMIIDENSFGELLDNGRVLFFGNGADKCRDVLKSQNAVFIGDIVPTASTLGMLAADKFAIKEFEDLAGFAPLYLKEFIAKEAKPLI